MDTEWVVELEGAALNDLWGALNDPDPDPDPEVSYFIKVRVARFEGFSVHIYSKEHPPPHFRIWYAGERADFTIKDCQPISGGLQRYYPKIRAWHRRNKQRLIQVWDEHRPTNCPVGVYSEGDA